MMRLRGVWHGCGGDERDMILRFVSYMRRPMRMEVLGGSTPVRGELSRKVQQISHTYAGL
ncbi:MAG: hypothetical protein RXO28_02125 [Thermocladium sp.]